MKTSPPKINQPTATQKKESENMVPQVRHGLEGGDPSEKSCNLAPSKEKKGLKGRMGCALAPRADAAWKEGTP